jgi:hypothetical protein
MKIHVIRLNKGEEAVNSILNYCTEAGIKSASFTAIGAASKAKLAIYDLNKKEYIRKEFSKTMEILNLSGNISLLDNNIVVHSHVVLSDEDFSAFGGHVEELTIAATCEIVLTEILVKLTRKADPIIGLNLLDL